jgi:hypothetical protein
MVFYIAVIIFHNQDESNPISMVFYIAVIIYDSVIISLTYCFLNISPDALCYRHMFCLFFKKIFYQNMGQKLGSDSICELLTKADGLYPSAKSSVIVAFPPLFVKCQRTISVYKVVGDCGISSVALCEMSPDCNLFV